MKAVTYHGKRDVRVDTVPDPGIKEPTDAVVRITSSGICGSLRLSTSLRLPRSPTRETAPAGGHQEWVAIRPIGL